MFADLFGRSDKSKADLNRELNDPEEFTMAPEAEGNMSNSEDRYVDQGHLPDTETTSVGEGSVVEGDLDVKGRLNVHGVVQGRIRCDSEVFIGEAGRVNGEVLAMNIRVAGQIEGSLECGELTILRNGKVAGEAATDTFIISEGGEFEGNSRRRTADNVTQLMRGARNAPAAMVNSVKE